MLVELHSVFVPYSGSAKQFMVPEYDIPIIKALWKPELQPGEVIEVTPTGVIAFRKLQDEEKRIRREWSATPKGAKQQAWEHVYSRDMDFVKAWEEASAKGHKLQAINEKKAAALAAKKAEDEKAASMAAEKPKVEK